MQLSDDTDLKIYNMGREHERSRMRSERRIMRMWEVVLCLVIGIFIGMAMRAEAESVQTSVTVVVSAEVPCNPENCKEATIDGVIPHTTEGESGW